MATARGCHVFLHNHPEPLPPGPLQSGRGVASGLHFGVMCTGHPLPNADTPGSLVLGSTWLDFQEHLEEARKEQGGPGQQGA